MDLVFRVLGPLELVVDGRCVPLGPPKQRAMIATLLREPNEVVSVRRIVSELWPGSAPASAVANVRTYAAGVRGLLGQAGEQAADRLVTTRGGYRIQLGDDELDAAVFEATAKHARAASARADLPTALKLFAAALESRRGAALADIDEGPLIRAWAAQLDELYLGVYEDAALVELTAGVTPELVGRLRSFVAEYPVRERAWGHLMLALYRVGDLAAALRAFQDARLALAEHLGIEPGRALSELQQAILSRSPSLDDGPSVSSDGRGAHASLGAVPRMLPRTPQPFVGRRDELAHLIATLTNGSSMSGQCVVVAVYGPGGSGKSALAGTCAHLVAAHYPDGQVYIDLLGSTPGRRPLEPADALAQMLRALGVDAMEVRHGPMERAGQFRSLLAERRVLLVLDNARDAAQVRPLLPATGRSAVIVTSRTPLSTLDFVVHVALGPLPDADAVDLLREFGVGDRVHTEADAVAEIVTLCAGLPLALRVVGAQLATRPTRRLSDVAGALADDQRRLDELSHGDLAMRTALEASDQELVQGPQQVDTAAALAFRVLGVLPARVVAMPALAAALDVAMPVAARTAERLIGVGLVSELQPGRLWMHDLVRSFAAERAGSDVSRTDREMAVARAAVRYLAGLHQAKSLVVPSRQGSGAGSPVVPSGQSGGAGSAVVPSRQGSGAEPEDVSETGWPQLVSTPSALTWFDEELPEIVAVSLWCAQTAEHGKLSVDIAAAAYPMLPMRGRFTEWDALCESALDWARRVGDLASEAGTLVSLATSHVNTATSPDDPRLPNLVPLLHRAVQVHQELGNVIGESRSESTLALAYVRMGQPDAAVGHFDRAIELRRTINDEVGEAIVLSDAAEARYRLGQIDACLADLERSLALRRKCGDLAGEATTLCNLGEVYLHQGRVDDAAAVLDDSVRLCQVVGNEFTEAEALINRATVHGLNGAGERARVDAVRGVDLFRRRGSDRPAEKALRQLADRLRQAGWPPARVDALVSSALQVRADASG